MSTPTYNNSQALEDRASFGARLSSPSAARNRDVIGEQLSAVLPSGARVLEIASGTGEHALHMVTLRPDLRWQPSDIDADSRASQDAWRLDAPERMAESLHIDTTTEWWEGLPALKAASEAAFDALFCANMIHIAPWEAAVGLADGAGRVLASGGLVLLYGPFLKSDLGDDATAPSNLDFDRSLKARNPAWGVRALTDVKALFAKRGLALERAVPMPANNDLLVFRRD